MNTVGAKPLVSIMIPNYNHSRYLDECIQSALHQTYKNIEIVVLDNTSEDESVKVASKYMSQGVTVCRNCYNVNNMNYNILADHLTSGKYMMLLCADDYILPTFVERAVQIMEEYPNVGYVHGERDFVLEDGTMIDLDPFFCCSFRAPGVEMMPIYMVTTIAHPAQGIFRRSAYEPIGGYDREIDHMNADKSLWFYLSYVSDYAYIREKMCRIRIGSQTETVITQRNFQHPILCHLTIKDFVKFAKEKQLVQVYQREKEALQVLSKEFLIYAGGMLAERSFRQAKQYLDYAKIMNKEIMQSENYKKLMQMYETKEIELEEIRKMNPINHQRKRSYQPPEHYIEMEEK